MIWHDFWTWMDIKKDAKVCWCWKKWSSTESDSFSQFVVFHCFWHFQFQLSLLESAIARTLHCCNDMIFTAPGKLLGLLWLYYDHAPHFHFQLNFSSLHWLKHFPGMHFLFLQGKLHSIVLVTDQSEIQVQFEHRQKYHFWQIQWQSMLELSQMVVNEVLRTFTHLKSEPKFSANTQHIQFDQIKREFGCLPKKDFILV